MITVSDTYNSILENGHYEWQIVNGTNTIKDALIEGSLKQTLFEELSIGNVLSSQLDIQYYKEFDIDTAQPLKLQFRAVSDSAESNWYDKGTFWVDTLETSPYTDKAKITAFDAMLMTEYVYQLSGSWTATTDLIILNRITSVMAVTLEATTRALFEASPKTISTSPAIGEDGTTAREILSAIGAMRGGNWTINSDNELELIILSNTPSDTANIGDAVLDFDASPTETVTKLRVWVSDDAFYAFPELPLTDHNLDPITTHTLEEITVRAAGFFDEWNAISGRCLDVKIFFADYEDAKALYTQFVGKSYYPYSTQQAYVPVEYELGDGITIKDVTSVIADQTLNLTPLSSSSVELKKEEAINSLYPYKNPIARQTSRNSAQISSIASAVEANTEAIAEIPTIIQEQTDLITGGFGGYIKYNFLSDGTPSEMLIMDTPSEDTATNLIRLNMNGIGFSTDGGATYGTAWTIDGKFNADYIQTGTLSADRIAANSIAVSKLTGSIADSSNTWEIDLTTGSMTIGNITANKITSGTLNVGNLTVTGTIQDNLSTPKNYWNLTTGEFVTTQGTLGGFTIDANGIYKLDTASPIPFETVIRPSFLRFTSIQAATDATLTTPTVYERTLLDSTGLTLSASTDGTDNVGLIISTQMQSNVIVSRLKHYSGSYDGITFTRNISTNATSLSLQADSVLVNSHAVLEIH